MTTAEKVKEEKSDLSSELSGRDSEITLLKANEEELHKVKAARSVDEVARKDLEDQLETEQHFRSLYKTQAATLQDEVEEARDKIAEVEADAKKNHRLLQQALEAMDKGNIEKRVLEEDLNELEREKVMLEYELDNAGAKHKADLRNLEIQ